MNLATRCSACDTVFRVVEDQLKVSEGWVRCGRCDTVFNATDQLFDLTVEKPRLVADPVLYASEAAPVVETVEAAARHEVAAPTAGAEWPSQAPEPGWRAEESFALPLYDTHMATPPTPFEEEPQQPVAPLDTFAAADPHAELLLAVPGADAPHAMAAAFAAAAPVAPAGAAVMPDNNTPGIPEFLRHAERHARWQRPAVQWAVRAAALLLLLMLAAQVVHHLRDGIAARWPALTGPLTAWCSLAACRIEPLRRIADVTVENTALAPATAGAGTFLLSVTLRNRGRLPLAMPDIDLSLTDTRGELVARRALAPSQFQNLNGVILKTPQVLRPDVDERVQATIAAPPRVVGYTVELFYP